MLSIFATPKPFIGNIGTIQRNAIRSWTLLRPEPEIILVGNEEGTADLCKELCLKHIAHVERNKYGTPLLDDIFKKAHELTSYNTLCFLNADIIMMNDFMVAAERVIKSKSRFLLIGERWDFDLHEPLDYNRPAWEKDLIDRVKRYGIRHGFSGVDYYLFPKGIFGDIPPFAVGRPYYDNWLIWRARFLSVPVIDATRVITSIHQNHERTYSSMSKEAVEGEDSFRKSAEVEKNLEISNNTFGRIFNLLNSTHVMTSIGIRPAFRLRYLKRRLETSCVKNPVLKQLIRLLIRIFAYVSKSAPVPRSVAERYCKKYDIDLESLIENGLLSTVCRFGRISYKFCCNSEYDLLFLSGKSKKIIDLYREAALFRNKITWI
jgi:hypothetical protein